MTIVTIVLPPQAGVPVGGYKVHYQLANTLAARGCDVHVVHVGQHRRSPSLPRLRWVAHRSWRRRRVDWYALDQRIHVTTSPHLNARCWPASDLTVLTGYQTSGPALRLRPRMGSVVQVVYDYELWADAPEHEQREIQVSLSRPDVPKIASSRVVADMLRRFGVEPLATIGPGHDLRPATTEQPRRPSLLAPLRAHPSKGAEFALQVIRQVHARRPGLRMVAFGDWPSPGLPAWVEFCGRVSEAELAVLRAEAAVFLAPSRSEGFGLTALEAMATGAVVVSADNGGIRDYGIHLHNCLIVAYGDVAAAADAVLTALEDDALAGRLRAAAAATAAQHTAATQSSALADLVLSR